MCCHHFDDYCTEKKTAKYRLSRHPQMYSANYLQASMLKR